MSSKLIFLWGLTLLLLAFSLPNNLAIVLDNEKWSLL